MKLKERWMKGSSNYERMSLFDQLREGLSDSLAQARGELTLRTTELPAPARPLTKRRVAAIRKEAGMSQAVFARFLNVPTKTLQSWEQGARSPKASEARLLEIAAAEPRGFGKLVIAASRRRPKGASKSVRKPKPVKRGK